MQKGEGGIQEKNGGEGGCFWNIGKDCSDTISSGHKCTARPKFSVQLENSSAVSFSIIKR